ncbi:hypothetical protein N7448_010743 [Penicillium atrosanguineum]|uniref:transcriptional regulator family: Fungal Specific TF n=1 Tax=Penicillium atrosanguineum TaxID=1132637 RepID=UPI0023A43D6D|nr:transcriptional regulator family: Fungal Specific TF [Penicillium atrosanguineum]KAJ5119034.1 hypothetical protein N7526_010671 [Penicillium atrosanguineum]KAJ5120074.1 hypothetical protein N7448_010743 [Penicillium atrosanguineum]KAJ5297072.1 transcriptional regulator family: Fungal Specific TF [Penicillium atrosanguineum]
MATPQNRQPPQRSRGFSVKSDKSHISGNSGHKSQLSESSEEKHRRNLHTKADPTIAMNELQPMAVALEKSNMGSLREMEHKDQFGNVITDPDWSNPTRPRFERPLDTIKAFEAAIYGTYSSNRQSYIKTDEAASQMGDYSRRTSYYGPNGHSNRGYDQNANYGRAGPSRPDSVADNYGQENQTPYQNRRQRHPRRTDSDQVGYNGSQSNQRSYDNVAAMSGSGSAYTGPYGQGTDPSSLNSSMDQLSQYAQRADGGYNGQSSVGNTWGAPQQAQGQGPPVMQMSKSAKTAIAAPPEKRKSWLKKRFSKN